MSNTGRHRVVESLREQIAEVERRERRTPVALPFGLEVVDGALPSGGLRLAALLEVAGGGPGAIHGAAAVMFVAGVLARMEGPVLWYLRQRDLFAPGLAGVGLHSERVIYAEAEDEEGVLTVVEDGLKHAGLAAVVGEVGVLSMIASWRLRKAV